jgi:enoyl-CoA hydratase/carnithine racemase
MAYADIIVEKKGAVAWITLNKPQVKNALGKQTFIDILSALDDLDKDTAIMVVVFKGSGGTFCAGADFKEISQHKLDNDTSYRAEFTAFADKAFNTIENYKKVTIAMINGICMAGGIELAEVCDFIIADENVRVGDGHIRTGLVPNGGASIRMPRLIGMRKAKELLFTGDLLNGKEAERIGLVNKAVPADKLEQTVEDLIARMTDKPPLALQAMKTLVNRGMGSSLEAGTMLEHLTVEYLETTEDFKESMMAFAEKRKPIYKGK